MAGCKFLIFDKKRIKQAKDEWKLYIGKEEQLKPTPAGALTINGQSNING